MSVCSQVNVDSQSGPGIVFNNLKTSKSRGAGAEKISSREIFQAVLLVEVSLKEGKA
jgi:hypothetical protein